MLSETIWLWHWILYKIGSRDLYIIMCDFLQGPLTGNSKVLYQRGFAIHTMQSYGYLSSYLALVINDIDIQHPSIYSYSWSYTSTWRIRTSIWRTTCVCGGVLLMDPFCKENQYLSMSVIISLHIELRLPMRRLVTNRGCRMSLVWLDEPGGNWVLCIFTLVVMPRVEINPLGILLRYLSNCYWW